MTRIAALAALAFITAAGAARADDLRDLCPDRPLKGTSACTVDKGHWQVEVGVIDFTHDRTGGVTIDQWTIASPLVKYGLTDTLDVEAGLALYQHQRVSGGGASAGDSSLGDLYLRAKWHLMGTNGQDGLAIEPYIKLPTANHTLGNGAVEGGVLLPWQTNLPLGWALDVTPEVDVLKDQSGSGRHAAVSASAGITHPLNEDWSLGLELWTQHDFDPVTGTRQYSFDLALTWQPKGSPLALDGGLNLGLNKQTPDAEIYVGVSRRF